MERHQGRDINSSCLIHDSYMVVWTKKERPLIDVYYCSSKLKEKRKYNLILEKQVNLYSKYVQNLSFIHFKKENAFFIYWYSTFAIKHFYLIYLYLPYSKATKNIWRSDWPNLLNERGTNFDMYQELSQNLIWIKSHPTIL